MEKLISIIFILLFAGCTTTEYVKIDDGGYKDVLDVSLTRDDFKKTISYKGTLIGGKSFRNAMRDITAFIRAKHSLKNQSTSYQMYIKIVYFGDDGWILYDEAYDEDGREMDTTIIAREEHLFSDDCSSLCFYTRREYIAVNFGREYLEKYADTGVKIQISSSSNSEKTVVDLPSDYIKGFLSAVPVSGVPAQTETR